MKIKINWEDSNDEFYGVRKLQFHAMNNDPSQMRERLGYWLFNEVGAPAPRTAYVRVNINGSFAGLFLLVEQIDGRFTRDRFDDGTGNLFKQVWPLTTSGDPQAESALVAALETNEDEASVGLMLRFGEELAAAADGGEDITDVVERWMDIDEIIANQVVDRLIQHNDGPTNWRCISDTFCFLNNFFWYMDPTNERAHLIAWDLDASLSPFEIPILRVDSDWGEILNDCELYSLGGFGLSQRSATCDPLFAAWATYSDRYRALLDEVVAGPFSPETVEAKLAEWSAQIAEHTAEAYELHGEDGLSPEAWEAGLAQLRVAIDASREEVTAAAANLGG